MKQLWGYTIANLEFISIIAVLIFSVIGRGTFIFNCLKAIKEFFPKVSAYIRKKFWGVPKDPVKKFEYYRYAAEEGVVDAQNRLGVMYAKGEGVEQDYAEAKKWFLGAAEQGHDAAQFNLGRIYHDGLGVEQNYTEAERWWRLAGEQENPNALHNLGVMYHNGRGVEKNDAEAVRWWRLAAEQGHASSQFNMGIMCSHGNGVAENYTEAYMWYYLAAQQNHEGAKQAYIMLENLLSQEEIQKAKQSAKEWIKKLVAAKKAIIKTDDGNWVAG